MVLRILRYEFLQFRADVYDCIVMTLNKVQFLEGVGNRSTKSMTIRNKRSTNFLILNFLPAELDELIICTELRTISFHESP